MGEHASDPFLQDQPRSPATSVSQTGLPAAGSIPVRCGFGKPARMRFAVPEISFLDHQLKPAASKSNAVQIRCAPCADPVGPLSGRTRCGPLHGRSGVSRCRGRPPGCGRAAGRRRRERTESVVTRFQGCDALTWVSTAKTYCTVSRVLGIGRDCCAARTAMP